MLSINLNKRIFWIVALLIILANSFLTIYIYNQKQSAIEIRAFARSESLKEYFISMRYVYHQQFLNSGLDLDESTVGFLPAHASTLISDRFTQISKDKITIRNVTDKPRNPKNLADSFEQEAIEFFKNNPNETGRIKRITQDSKEILHYTSPLVIEKYCISCHGKKEEVLPSILKMYDTAYDYKIGDIRGVTSIKIPIDNFEKEAIRSFYQTVFFTWSSILLLLIVVYYAISKLTRQEVEQKRVLQKEVMEKTADLNRQKDELENAYVEQKHLFSILRTVADCNQILITAKSVEELINKTALSMHQNTTFASVKISIVQNDRFVVKTSVGLDESYDICSFEREAFLKNEFRYIEDFSDESLLECKDKVQKYLVNEIYIAPLRRNFHADEALGIITIYTAQEFGFSQEEKDMINELAGDIGFAINSFYQKEAINRLSFYDPLTYLPNQKLFEQHLSQALSNSNKNLKYGALLFLDFDNFKNVNDLLEKSAGDEILREVAQRLSTKIHQDLFVARHGGDKFLILLENLSDVENEAAILAKKMSLALQDIIEEPFTAKENLFYLTCSIGIVLFLDHKESVNRLFNEAEYAMRTAKAEGKNTIRFYDESLQNMTKSRLEMLRRLREALKNKYLTLYFQKQFDKDKQIIGVEALVRWIDPALGVIPPAEFIPLAEDSGLIHEIGDFVLEFAAQKLLLWRDDPLKREWRVSVNVSPLQFKEDSFIPTLKTMLESKNIDFTKLRVELTEGVLLHDQKQAMQKISALKKLGISVSIDDFGTGYSSLVYLKNLKIDELKIDQSFVSGLVKNRSDRTIIKTIIMMGEELGFEVIAEGVETDEQFEILKELGCGYFQGYLLARPCKAEEL